MRKKVFEFIIIIFLFLSNHAIGNTQKYDLYPVEIDEKWGYFDQNGKVVIDPIYFMALPFNTSGIAAVVDDSGWVYINSDGLKLLRPFIVDNGPDYFVEGLARFVKKDGIGFFDQSGKVVIPAQFKFVQPFSEGLAGFCNDCRQIKEGEYHRISAGKWGYIDRWGNVVIAAKYDLIQPFLNGKAEVKVNKLRYQIDRKGQKIKDIE